MALITSLANHLLIAMPSLHDPNFEKSVVYVCEHHTQGSVGLIINRPMQYPLSIVFEQLEIEPIRVEQNRLPLLFGGPVQPERGFVIHKQIGGWRSSLFLQDEVTVTTSNDIIRAIAQDAGPKDVLVTLGYSSWIEKQLEQEVMDNVWLVCPYKSELLYEVPFAQRWEYAGSLLGIKMNQLVSSAGHA
ncbi:YqgE/AlgH family protein [Legionella sp. km772]|uniref:YqgE/AlgH family protein n=1 Tax=Legionella sp. km772 TaxID=2498111 RepID=UPI000F8F4B97|nr:YqgE/AlgH family protein [Legionella sp. km772]RUR12339.1 YqgE/AlgH family protein [Legionella sp. km772]